MSSLAPSGTLLSTQEGAARAAREERGESGNGGEPFSAWAISAPALSRSEMLDSD